MLHDTFEDHAPDGTILQQLRTILLRVLGVCVGDLGTDTALSALQRLDVLR